MNKLDVLDFLSILTLISLFVWIAELALAAKWNHFYFTVGLPIYIHRVPVNSFRIVPVDTNQIESVFLSTFTSKALLFRELETNLYAFREKIWELRTFKMESSEIMHGVIIFDQAERQIIVKGYLNWIYIMVLLAIIGISLIEGIQNLSPIYIILGLAYGVIYFFQARRYGKVAQKAAELAESGRKVG